MCLLARNRWSTLRKKARKYKPTWSKKVSRKQATVKPSAASTRKATKSCLSNTTPWRRETVFRMNK
jgi:hypothetical protein